MKKTLISCCSMCVMTLLTSCYSTTVSVGDLDPTDPVVEANKAHNAHFIGGLVGSPKLEDQNYVGNNKNYMFKDYQTFGDALLTGITLGIYSPTTTKFYLPYGSDIPEKIKTHHEYPKFGIRAGLNFSSVSSDYDLSGKVGPNIGLVLDFPIYKSLFLTPGVYYSQKGHKGRYGHFLEFHPFLSYRYELMPDIQLQAGLGPYIGGSIEDEEDRDIDPSVDFGGVNYGLRIGAGATYKKHYYLGVSYDFDFSDYSLGYYWSDDKSTARLHVFSVNIGYNF